MGAVTRTRASGVAPDAETLTGAPAEAPTGAPAQASTGAPTEASAEPLLAVPDRARMARRASSFSSAARLLPADVRGDIALLYETVRALDDLVDDGAPDASRRVAAVSAWARGRPHEATPETARFAHLAARHPIPPAAVAEFCLGMGDDLRGWRPETERDVDRYCHRVAGTVGVMMAAMLGCDHPAEAFVCASSLGVAMQRTNILRDIDEDAAVGRVYIAARTLRACGGSLAPGDRAALLRDQITRADERYEDGLLGVALLRRGRGAITLAAGLYREILREIEREGLGARGGRAVVAPPRRAATTLRVALIGR